MINYYGLLFRGNTIINTVQIVQEVTPGERYLVSFLNAPASMRICHVDEMMRWQLFPNRDAAEQWIAANQQRDMDLGPETQDQTLDQQIEEEVDAMIEEAFDGGPDNAA